LKNEINLKSPGWVIDPFGVSPFLSLELAQNGYSVLTASNNPIINFMIRVLARAPGESDFKAALSELSRIRRGDEWLDQHLMNLYTTECPQCGQPARSLFFTWKKGENLPESCMYECDFCHSGGKKPCDLKDFEKINQLGSNKLHRARALQRVTGLHSSIEEDVNQVLENYLSRPLYFITTLINKIEGSAIPAERKELLHALTLSICDQGNTLWGYPSVRSRPKQLITPPSFKEFNLWAALEDSIKFWIGQRTPVNLVTFPESPGKSGGICLYTNRLKSIPALPDEISPEAAICVFPRPNQAFWTLSAVWSGWLWGKEAASPMKAVFERKRYDWSGLDSALSSTLVHLSRLIPQATPVFSMVSELDPGFIVASLHAANNAGFDLESAALNEEDGLMQIWWKTGHVSGSSIQNIPALLEKSVTHYLSQSAEPVSYLKLFSNTLLETAHDRILTLYKIKNNQNLLKSIQTDFDKILISNRRLIKYPPDCANLESAAWGIQSSVHAMTISDNVEMEIVNFLNHHPLQEYGRIENDIFEHFPGLLTPSHEFINFCLNSYAVEVNPLPGFPGEWQLHSRENPSTRKMDLQDMISILIKVGTQAGFQVSDHNPLTWMNTKGEQEYVFYIIASSIISRYVYSPVKEARNRIIVMPGSRSRLLAYKLENDLNLADAVKLGGWKFMKFRHIRALSHKENITPKMWADLIGLDPPVWDDAVQLTIFPHESV